MSRARMAMSFDKEECMKRKDGASRVLNAFYFSVAGISFEIGMVTVCASSPSELSGTKEFERLINAKDQLSAAMHQAAKVENVPNCRKIRAACKSFINSVNTVKSMPSAQDKDLRQCLGDLKQSAQEIMDKVA